MRERLLRADLFEHERSRREGFDPIAEGRWYGLAPDVSTALWEYARREATNRDGICDENAARDRFAQLAELTARRGGQLGPEPFHWTQLDVASGSLTVGDPLARRVPGRTTHVLAAASARARFALGEGPGWTTLTANSRDSDVGSEEESRGFCRRYVSGGQAARAKLERAIASRDHYAAVVATGALKQDLASARRHLANGLERDEGLRANLASLEGPAKQLLAKLPNMSAGGRPWELWGPDSAEWRAVIHGTAAVEASSAAVLLAPPARRARHEDTEHLLAHAAPVPLFPQLVLGDIAGDIERPPASDSPRAAAYPQAAASNGGPGAPHPVDALRANARGLAASLTSAGLGIGRATARWMQAAADRPIARRAVAIADQWTEGAARAWTERARGWADGAARRAMAFRDRMAGPDATEQIERLPTSGGALMSDELRARMEALFGHRFLHVRIHTDDAAAQATEAAGAGAVTLGSHIYFGRDQFAPGSEAGDRLLVHELTHVVQYDRGQLAEPAGPGVELSSPSDPAEREARAMEARAADARTPETLPRVRALRSRPGDTRRAGAQVDMRSANAPLTHPRSPEELSAQFWCTGAQADGAQADGAQAIGAQAAGAGPAARVAVAPGARAKVTSGPSTDAPVTGRRASANIFGDAANWVGDRIDDVENWAEDKIEGLVAKVAPGLATLINEGPGGLIKDALEPAIKSWVGSVTGGVNIGQIAGQLQGSFASAFAVLEGAKGGDEKCCNTLVKGIEAIRSVANAFMNNPVMDAIKGIFTKVSDIIGTVTKLVVGPVFDLLKSIVGPAWDAIKSVASTVSGWLSKVKSIASKAFDWVAKKLGFSSATGEGGLTDWIQQKAIEVWDKIKSTLAPVIGPLKVVAGALLLFTGLPQIYAIMKYGPQLVEAVQWMWANRNNPNAAKENPGLLGGTIFPKIVGVGQGFVTTVKSGVTWLVQQTTALATGALNLAGAVTGVPLLSMATGFVHTLADGVKSVETWAEGAFTSAEKWLEGLYKTVADFISKYAKVLTQVAIAVTNPAMIPVILAGEAWQWLPDCIKPPLIDLLLDAVIAILRGMPMLPMLGLLWPLLKSGVIGFLEAVKGRDAHTKAEVSNKLAKIISGGSPMFLLGFVKGLLKGVWDGIKMPFEAIWMVAKGIQKAGDFFAALGSEADKKAAPAAATATSPATATAPKTKPPLPGVPSVITPEQASSVVGGIASTLVAQKPKEPPPAPGAPPHAAAKPGQQNEYKQLAGEAKRMGGELAGPGQKVATQFWPAVQELFSGGGKSMSLDDLIAKLSKVWQAAKGAVAKLGAKIANMIVDFLMKPGAEEEIGEAIGYMVGMIAFQALLDYLSAGTWTGAMGVISAIAKFLNWPMEFLGEAMKALKALGGFILDGLKSLGSMVAEASAGALREVMGAFREIGTKLGEFAEELASKFRGEAEGAGKAAEKDAAGAVEKDAASAAEKDAANAAEKDAGSTAEKEAMKAEELGEALEISRVITTAEDAGHMPGPAIAFSLQALRSRYSWIKTYEAVPNAQGFEIFLIASRFSVGQAHTELGKLPNGLGDHFSKLSDEAAVAFSALPEAELEKLVLLNDAQLLNLAKLDEAGLAKIASLDINTVEKLATLEPAALAKLSRLDPAGLGKLASLEETALTKFTTLDQKALGKFVTLDEAALQKFAKLDDSLLAKFGSLREANMIEAYGKLSQEHLEKLARLDKNVLEKFAGWAHDPPPRPGFNNILENIAKQDEPTIDLIASLKPKPLALSENAAKVVDTVRIRIAGSEYQIDHDVVEHILQRHSREFWEGSVKAEQSFLPAGFGPDEIVDVIRDVLRKNEAEVARIGVGYGPLPLTTSHGITWQLGLNGGHVGQLYPKF